MQKNVSPNKRAVIFDFDGTIADTILMLREIYVEMAPSRNLPYMDEETYMRLRKRSVKEVAKWVGVKPWQLPGIMKEGRTLFAKKAEEVKMFAGAPELIKYLHHNGWDVYVLSSNGEDTIKKVLVRHKVLDIVTILRRPPIFGKSKSISRLVKQNNYKKSDVWMIGDEVRDVEAGKKAGVKTISVSWGLQDASALQQKNPDFLAHKFSDLKNLLNQ